ncbi:hypothetical protein BCR44DRAFT_1428589 [Catenaria anguillulae PL171]|uniref:Uncharacterized protein n=1 Tax=Catenaria anguillulae PL171 TaxID=765915 RepID=A0A1Y2HXC6_9FUNG|nr:hypothetical protein BCR44DRAFT_1428589 [Catenaria anguillulae PL171]
MLSIANPQPPASTILSAPCPTCNVRAVGRRPKSKVLVVLPPTYRSANLDRLLLLARDAYDNEELDIMDMNIQFAWIGQEMIAGVQPGEASVAPAPAVVSPAAPVAAATVPAPVAPQAPATAPAPATAAKAPAVVDADKQSKTAACAPAAAAPSAGMPALQGVAATGVPFEEQWKRNAQAQSASTGTPAPQAAPTSQKKAQSEPKKQAQKQPEPKPATTPAAPSATKAAPVAAALADQKKPAPTLNNTTPAATATRTAKQASAPKTDAAQPKPAPAPALPPKPASPTPAAAPKATPPVSTSNKPSTPEPPKPATAPAGPNASGLADWIKQGLRTLASSPTPSATSSTGTPTAGATANDDVPAGPITEHRVRVSNFLPTVQDYQMIMLLPSGIKLHKVEFHPPEHIGPNFKLVRSATFTFATAHEADTMAKWIKDQNAGGQLGKLLLPKTKVSVVMDTVEPLEEIDEELEVRTATSIKKPATRPTASAAPATKVDYDIPMEEIDEDMDPMPPAPRSAAASQRESPVFAAKSGNDYSPPSPAKSVPAAAPVSGAGFTFSLPEQAPAAAKSSSPTGNRFTVKMHGIDGFTPAPLVQEFVLEHTSVKPKGFETEASTASGTKSASPFQTHNDKSVVFVFDNKSDAKKLTSVLHQGSRRGEIRVEACDGKVKTRADLTGGVTTRQVGGQTVVAKVVGGTKVTSGGVFADQALAGPGLGGVPMPAASEASGNGKAGGKAKKGKAGTGGGKWRSKYDDMD